MDFLTEVRAILSLYPAISARLFYADAELYGPHELSADVQLPGPKGGGGTSFRPFFDTVDQQDSEPGSEALCVYFTDGYGEFPSQPVRYPVLWVVTAGGLEENEFPFGEVVRF